MAAALGGRFTKLWAASTTSALGSGLATIAAPLYVAAHTRSPLIVSATSGVAWLLLTIMKRSISPAGTETLRVML